MKAINIPINLCRQDQAFDANISFIQGQLDELFPYIVILHEEERKAYEALNYKRRKASYLLGRLASKKALMNLTDVKNPRAIWIDSGVFYYPVIRSKCIQNTQVSISHCDDLGISLAFPEVFPMGIDLEKVCVRRVQSFVSRISDNEKQLLRKISMDNISGYTALWTIKEALSKIIKTGMTVKYELLEVNTLEIENGILKSSFTHFGQYISQSHVDENYAFSLTLPKRTNADLSEIWKVLSEFSQDNRSVA